jgi:hypothetical protein
MRQQGAVTTAGARTAQSAWPLLADHRYLQDNRSIKKQIKVLEKHSFIKSPITTEWLLRSG